MFTSVMLPSGDDILLFRNQSPIVSEKITTIKAKMQCIESAVENIICSLASLLFPNSNVIKRDVALDMVKFKKTANDIIPPTTP